MVKHQRRSHQRGINPDEMLEDCTSDSDGGETPSRPKPVQGVIAPGHPDMPHAYTVHRAASFADFGHHMNNYSMSSDQVHGFYGQPVLKQHHVLKLRRTASVPQNSYYVTEQTNLGVATMNINPMLPHHRIPYSATGMPGPIQSSPSSFSAASGRSPSTQEGFHTHQPTQAETYALHSASPIEQQAPPQPSPAPPSMEQFQQFPAQYEPAQCYNNVEYDAGESIPFEGLSTTWARGLASLKQGSERSDNGT
jgi:metal regulatory transcription factor 1